MFRFFLLFFIVFCSASFAQDFPRGQFLFPTKPGQTTSLSGSFGDIRVNHFHAGLDVRTGGVEGEAIFSIGDGYVSRINISKNGYGNALYITHPNGFTSVYAHLQDFGPTIKPYLTTKQYEEHKWDLDFNLQPNEILVRKGELVAISGNTGGSGGPHLHFEIRDANENVINPALFGFYEVQDNVAPIIETIALITLDASARINGQFGEFIFPVSKQGIGSYVISQKITAVGKIGVKINTYDKAENSPFRLGVTFIELKNNGVNEYVFDLVKMPFDTKLDMNLHTDYEKMITKGQKWHKCYVEEGNRLPHYSTNDDRGLLTISENQAVAISIKVQDSYKNTSFLNFTLSPEIQNSVEQIEPTSFPLGSPQLKTTLYKNILKIEATGANSASNEVILQKNGTTKTVKLAYGAGNKKVFLYDLSSGIPETIQLENSIVPTNLTAKVSPKNSKYQNNTISIDFKDALYHELYLGIYQAADKLIIDKDIYPLKGKFEVQWTQTYMLPSEKLMAYLIGKKPKFVAGNWNGTTLVFTPKELGTYQLLFDCVPPTISPRQVNSNRLSFVISDNLSGIKEVKCFVNNQWVMMKYEPKSNLIWSEKLTPEPFVGEVYLEVTDNCNNKQIFQKIIIL
jgi:Peptidase family M23